jgi:hypothetical protein
LGDYADVTVSGVAATCHNGYLNGVWQYIGLTADGRPYYKWWYDYYDSVGRSAGVWRYMYYDADCGSVSGDTDVHALAGWIVVRSSWFL